MYRLTLVLPLAFLLEVGAAHAQRPDVRQKTIVQLRTAYECPMPVAVPSVLDRMPVAQPDSILARAIPVAPARCSNPLLLNRPSSAPVIRLPGGAAEARKSLLETLLERRPPIVPPDTSRLPRR